MIEDKLAHAERVRLECLAQAVAMKGMGGAGDVITLASLFEMFVVGPGDDRPGKDA